MHDPEKFALIPASVFVSLGKWQHNKGEVAEITLNFCASYISCCKSEKIVKIGPYLPKLSSK